MKLFNTTWGRKYEKYWTAQTKIVKIILVLTCCDKAITKRNQKRKCFIAS